MASSSMTSTMVKSYYPRRLQQIYRLTVVEAEAQSPSLPAQIAFHPDWHQFQDRVRRSLGQGVHAALPAGWPPEIQGPMSWLPANFPTDDDFVYHLKEPELAEIDSALQHFKSQDLHVNDVSSANFPLPVFAAQLRAIQSNVYHGIGCKVLRGLDSNKYSAEDLSVVLCGVSSYLANRRGKQDQEGSMIKHIVDFSKSESQVDLPFHTDVVCDVVATLTRECSEKGGMGTLAAGNAVYNALAATRPDLLRVLAEPDWPLDTFGRIPAFYRRALLYLIDGNAVFSFSRRVLTGHPLDPRTEGIPGLTERQAEALDAVHYAAKAHQTLVSMQKGDIRFVNNMGMLHGREAFGNANGDAGLSQRHLIRLWLHDEAVKNLPPALQLAWDRTFEDDERSARWDAEPRRDQKGELFGVQLSSCD